MAKKRKEYGKSQWVMVWYKLCENKFALVSLCIVVLMILMAIFAPLIAPYPFDEQNYEAVMVDPSLQHPFGTDQFGRDILSRIIYGSRYTIFIGFGCMLCSGLAGVTLGILAAYYPKLDNPIMRLDVYKRQP